VKEFEIASQVNSASLHPEQQVFVCGGEDFKMYKFDFIGGIELGESLFEQLTVNTFLFQILFFKQIGLNAISVMEHQIITVKCKNATKLK